MSEPSVYTLRNSRLSSFSAMNSVWSSLHCFLADSPCTSTCFSRMTAPAHAETCDLSLTRLYKKNTSKKGSCRKRVECRIQKENNMNMNDNQMQKRAKTRDRTWDRHPNKKHPGSYLPKVTEGKTERLTYSVAQKDKVAYGGCFLSCDAPQCVERHLTLTWQLQFYNEWSGSYHTCLSASASGVGTVSWYNVVLPFTPLWVHLSLLEAKLERSWVLLAEWLQVDLSILELMPIHFYSKWCTAWWQVNSAIHLWIPETGLLACKKFSLTSNHLELPSSA